MGRVLFYVVLVCVVGSAAAAADEPLAPQATVTVCSASGDFCATSDPGTGETIVHRRDETSPLWKIHGWYRWLLVTNDGHRVVIGYPGLNLIPQAAEMNTQVFRIYGPAGLVKSLSLGDLYRSKSQLAETASHYEWEKSVSLDATGHLVVEREDGSKVAFDPITGNHL
jgi:hypothetical protein